jgi:hypothetical protein
MPLTASGKGRQGPFGLVVRLVRQGFVLVRALLSCNLLAMDALRGALQMGGHGRVFFIVRCHGPKSMDRHG